MLRTSLLRTAPRASIVRSLPAVQQQRQAHAISSPTLANIEKRWEGMPPQEQADLWMALRDRMKANWGELTVQEKKAGLCFVFPIFLIPSSFLPSCRSIPLHSCRDEGWAPKRVKEDDSELMLEENSILHRLRRPRPACPPPTRRRLEGGRLHSARRRGFLRDVRRHTHGCEGIPRDHEQGVSRGDE
jgi:Cytochrome c oxidase subunit IV